MTSDVYATSFPEWAKRRLWQWSARYAVSRWGKGPIFRRTGIFIGIIRRNIGSLEGTQGQKKSRRTRRREIGVVAHTGFEPVISALRGRRPGPLDECAMRWRLGSIRGGYSTMSLGGASIPARTVLLCYTRTIPTLHILPLSHGQGVLSRGLARRAIALCTHI